GGATTMVGPMHRRSRTTQAAAAGPVRAMSTKSGRHTTSCLHAACGIGVIGQAAARTRLETLVVPLVLRERLAHAGFDRGVHRGACRHWIGIQQCRWRFPEM